MTTVETTTRAGDPARGVYARKFLVLQGRTARRALPLAAAVGGCLGCFLAMIITDVPWLDRILVGSPLFAQLLTLVVCPAIALVLADIFVGMEAAMTFVAAAERNLDAVWTSLGFSPYRILVSTRRWCLYLTGLLLYFTAWVCMRYGLEGYLEFVAQKSHLAWMPLMADSPLAYGALLTLLTVWFVDRATLVEVRNAPLVHWPAERRWAFVMQRQFLALASGVVVLGLAFVFYNRWST